MRSLILFFFLATTIFAQDDIEVVSYYPFTNGMVNDEGLGDRNGILGGNPQATCGIIGDAISFNGNSDFVRFPDNFSTIWDQNWTLSFYMKPVGLAMGEQQVISYTNDCGDINFFDITYTPSDRLLRVSFGDDVAGSVRLETNLEPNGCWFHIVLVRDGRDQRLYVNNVEVDDAFNQIRIDFNNPGVLSIADGPCVGTIYTRFEGALDELRLYNQVLPEFLIRRLFFAPQTIVTMDTLIFLGGQVNVRVNENCTDDFLWTPDIGVNDPLISEPILQPDSTVIYNLRFREGNCITTDQLQVLVVDPEEVGCETLALPKAFTPNSDGLNDEFGISNPFVIDDLVRFRIWDRNGGLIFETNDPFDLWDGNFNGQGVNSGTYLYTIVYLCEGEEKQQQGTVVVIR